MVDNLVGQLIADRLVEGEMTLDKIARDHRIRHTFCLI
jgi:hypothetical protein